MREEELRAYRNKAIEKDRNTIENRLNHAFNQGYEMGRKMAKTSWIPVSERLPEDNTLVLVTVKVRNREPKVRSGYYYMDGHFHIDNGDCWEARDKELIAWCELPEPYKASQKGVISNEKHKEVSIPRQVL